MSHASAVRSENSGAPAQKTLWLRRILAATGGRVVSAAGFLLLAISTAVSVVWQGLRPLTWRRTVRRQFMDRCRQIGLNSLPFIIAAGSLIGVGLVYQLLYWLEVFGQRELMGRFLIQVLGLEVAPVLVGFFVLGRQGLVIVMEFGRQKAEGQIHMLDAQGIDPFLLLVVPCVLAAALSTFSLTVVFVVVALGWGFVLSNAVGATTLSVTHFIEFLLRDLEFAYFVLLPLKSMCIGYAIGLITCIIGLSKRAEVVPVETLLPRAFALSALAIIAISGMFTLPLLL